MTGVAKALAVQEPDDEGQILKPSNAVVACAQAVAGAVRVARFRGRAMLERSYPYPHFTPLSREKFDEIAYPLLGGMTRSRMADVLAYLANTAEDLSGNEHCILFGVEDRSDGGMQDYFAQGTTTRVWDMSRLEFVDTPPSEAVWRSPFSVADKAGPVPFVMSLAGNDPAKYDDIMQSLAPLVMEQKPDGVIWWVGDGANGKSTLMDAIYRIFPGQLSSITVKRLTDGRDTPSLNGTLGNIVKESSEGRIDDTEIYKAIGTHEDFRVHKFHSQDDITIRGNLHHVFSANNIPVFNDKGFSARRRTFVVPFIQRFESDPTFEERTFTPAMFGQLIAEMCRYAQRLRDQGYRYKFGKDTLDAKLEYDTEANNAEEYAKYIIAEGVAGFDNFSQVKMHYENWCAEQGFVPLGLNNLRRAVQSAGFDRATVRTGDGFTKRYKLRTVEFSDLVTMGMGHLGMYTVPGFQRTANETPAPPKFEEPAEEEVDDEPPTYRTVKDWSK